MAQPDYAAMSDDELRASYSAAEKEHKRRGQFHDAERHVRELLGNAVDLGIPRAKVEGFLNRLVNEYYPTA